LEDEIEQVEEEEQVEEVEEEEKEEKTVAEEWGELDVSDHIAAKGDEIFNSSAVILVGGIGLCCCYIIIFLVCFVVRR